MISSTYYPKIIADKMERGIENELGQIYEIGKVLCKDGCSRVQVNYYMNVDEDFISDVLSCYNYKGN